MKARQRKTTPQQTPELRLRMGIAAQDRVDEEYTWSQIILRKYFPVFEQVRRRG